MLILAITLAAAIWAEEAPQAPPPYRVVGELTQDDRKQIESIAPDKWGKRSGEKILGVTVTKPGIAIVSVGTVRGLMVASLRKYHVEKRDGKWRLVRIQYVIV